MTEFKVIEGRKSDLYNHFRDFEYISCMATDTRLMGVVAMRILWQSPDDPLHRYEQIIHLDFSEYGVDEYFEFEHVPDSEEYDRSLDEALGSWIEVSKDLGGRIVHLEPQVWLRLIDDSIRVAENNIMKRYDEFADFRRTTMVRLQYMKDVLKDAGLGTDLVSSAEAIGRVIPARLSTYEVINYFLMRLVDRDYEAAAMLTAISREELAGLSIIRPGIQSLMKNSIGESGTESGQGYLYGCESVTNTGTDYYLTTSVIELDGEPDDNNRRITDIHIGFMKTLSEYESAHLLAQSEYINVYDVPDEVLADFEIRDIDIFRYVSPKLVDNGWLLPIYRSDNSHVDKAIFHIGGDVVGSGLLTIAGELITMSSRVMDANALETSIDNSPYKDRFILKGRYHLKESVFQTICSTTGCMFEDLVSPIDSED